MLPSIYRIHLHHPGACTQRAIAFISYGLAGGDVPYVGVLIIEQVLPLRLARTR